MSTDIPVEGSNKILDEMKERLSKVSKPRKPRNLSDLSVEEMKERLERRRDIQRRSNTKRQAKIDLLRLIDKEDGMYNKILMLFYIYEPDFDVSLIDNAIRYISTH